MILTITSESMHLKVKKKKKKNVLYIDLASWALSTTKYHPFFPHPPSYSLHLLMVWLN
jgi:uncharacterized membrane protein YwzB